MKCTPYYILKIMRKTLFFITLIALTFSLQAQIKSTPKHHKATIFLQGATLGAKAQVSLPAGKSTIVFGGLSHGLKRESVRILSENVKLGSFSHKLNFLEIEARNKDLEKLTLERDALEKQLSLLNSQTILLTQEKDMILANKVVAGTDKGLEPAKLRELAEFYRSRLQDILQKETALQNEKENIAKKFGKIDDQITQFATQNLNPSSEIELYVEAAKAGTYNFDIEYFIHEAGWFPTYDFRVENLNNAYQIDYLASIYQNSGIDWKNMQVMVSSSDPSNTVSGIHLNPWIITPQNYKLPYTIMQPNQSAYSMQGYVYSTDGDAVPFAQIRVDGSSMASISDSRGKYAIQLNPLSKTVTVSATGFEPRTLSAYGGKQDIYLSPLRHLESITIMSNIRGKSQTGKGRAPASANAPAFDQGLDDKKAEEVFANVETSKNTLNLEYTLKDNIDIPSDGKPLSFLLKSVQTPGAYSSTVTPRVNNHAFLSIFIPEWEKLNLLEGEVNMYYAGSYIGKSSLNLSQVSDSLRFDFGKDPNIKTLRQLTHAKTANIPLSGNKQSSYRWTTEVRNTSDVQVKIKVVEPFPISQLKEIKVELDKNLSEAQIDQEKGLLIWELTLQAGEKKSLEFGYSVSYPKSMTLRFD